jgi:2-keto-myo-inositol isomerase
MKIALNTSTIKGHGLSVPDQISAAGEHGYAGIEPWVRDLDAFEENGGELRDLRALAGEKDLAIVNLIGFFAWLADDAALREEALAEARRNFRQAARLGCPFVAAPPFKMTEVTDLDLGVAAERFQALRQVAREVSAQEGFEVEPLLEFWGHSQALGTLGEALEVIRQCPGAKLLGDVFHMYKKGSDHTDLAEIPPGVLRVFHINDYPECADPGRQPDSERVYPGDGRANFETIREGLKRIRFDGWLSLELFNTGLYEQPVGQVLREGLEKSRTMFAR